MAIRIDGTVTFEHEDTVPRGTLHVLIEDVTHVDRAARVVTSMSAPLDAGRSPAEAAFVIDVPPPGPKQHYAVRVLVDVHGDGTIRPGDYVSWQAHPLAAALRIPVRKV